jgi:hypothetical protein
MTINAVRPEQPSCPRCGLTSRLITGTQITFTHDPSRADVYYLKCDLCGWREELALEAWESIVYGKQEAVSRAAERRKSADNSNPFASLKKRPRGRHKKSTVTRQFYLVGLAVEQEKPVFQRLIVKRRGLPERIRRRRPLLLKELLSAGFTLDQITAGLSSKTAQIAARHFVSRRQNLPVHLVAEYHRDYLRQLRPPASP